MFEFWKRMLGNKAPAFVTIGSHPGSKRAKTTRTERKRIRRRRKYAQNRNRYSKSTMWRIMAA